MLLRTTIVLATCLGIGSAAAQTHKPYAGLEKRDIKALSREQVDDLRAGRGMGLALAAELNGYPGPKHVLELSREMNLSEPQRAQMQRLFDDMQGEAIALGEKLIAQEAALDRSFAERSISETTLREATSAIGQTQAALRAAHLKYHLVTVAILTPEQVQHYTQLRGYSGGEGHHRREH